MEQLSVELRLSKKSLFSKSAKGGKAQGWWGARTSVSIQMPKHMWIVNLFTLAIIWNKKWEGGEADSTVDSHVLSQQM